MTITTPPTSTDPQHHHLAWFRHRHHERREPTAVNEFFENLVILLGFPSGR